MSSLSLTTTIFPPSLLHTISSKEILRGKMAAVLDLGGCYTLAETEVNFPIFTNNLLKDREMKAAL